MSVEPRTIRLPLWFALHSRALFARIRASLQHIDFPAPFSAVRREAAALVFGPFVKSSREEACLVVFV